MRGQPSGYHLTPDFAAEAWNAKNPVGTLVRYWRGTREGEGATGTTSSRAEVLGGHTAVVWINGCTGCVALSHVQPMKEEAR